MRPRLTIQRTGKPLNPGAILLFCLPPAGAGASVFYPLLALDSPSVNICPIAIPGREGRIQEPLPSSIQALAKQIASELEANTRQPFALLGYSMGALVGYELIHHWNASGVPAPLHFFPLAARPPHVPFQQGLHDAPNSEFRSRLSALGGMHSEILQNDELMEIYEPLLRNDFRNCDEYLQPVPLPVPCPVDAYISDQDPLVTLTDARSWEDCTQLPFRLNPLQGESHILSQKALLTVAEHVLNRLRAKTAS